MSRKRPADGPVEGQPGDSMFNSAKTLALFDRGGGAAVNDRPMPIHDQRGTIGLLDLPNEILLMILERALMQTMDREGNFSGGQITDWIRLSNVNRRLRRALEHVKSDLHFLTESGDLPSRSEMYDHFAVVATERFKMANINTLLKYVNKPDYRIAWDDLKMRVQLLFTPIQLNLADKYGRTPLMYACVHSLSGVAHLLLMAAVNIDRGVKLGKRDVSERAIEPMNQTFVWKMLTSKDETGSTALSLRVQFVRSDDPKGIITMLINTAKSKGILKYIINEPNNKGNTPLHYASRREEISEYLLSNGANPNVPNNDGETPLVIACYKEDPNIRVVRLLLSKGADFSVENKKGETILCHPDVSVKAVEALLDHVPISQQAKFINKKNESGHTALFYAIRWDNERLVRILLDKGADTTFPDEEEPIPLMVAIKYNSGHVVRDLIARGHDVNEETPKGTPLSCAIKYNNLGMISSFLLPNGCDIDKKFNSAGDTPLIYAIELDEWDIADLLTKKGANVNISNNRGQTPLHIINRYLWILKDLISKGANIDAKDKDGQTPLHYLCGCDNPSYYYMNISTLLDAGANVNLQDNDGNTPLHLLVLADQDDIIKVIKLFLRKNPNLAIQNKQGLTPEDLAISLGLDDSIIDLLDEDVDPMET